MTRYNQYSDKLEKILADARPKKGDTVIFRLLPTKGSRELAFQDTIIDPGTNKRITIAYVKGYSANPNRDSQVTELPELGSVSFTKEKGDQIIIHGDNSAEFDLFDFCFLSNSNQDNVGKDWYIAGNERVFKQSNPAKENREKSARKGEVLKAQMAVYDMSEAELLRLAKGLFSDYKSLDTEGIRLRLLEECEKDPSKAKGLSEDVTVATKNFIRGLEDDGIIKQGLKKWEWGDSGEKIVGVPPGKNALDFFASFLIQDKNKEIRDRLQELSEALVESK